MCGGGGLAKQKGNSGAVTPPPKKNPHPVIKNNKDKRYIFKRVRGGVGSTKQKPE